MSRVYWHSPSGEAELRGSERAWLDHVSRGPATAAWDFDRSSGLDRIAEILAMVPEVPDGEYGANYLHTYLRRAQQAKDEYHKQWKQGEAAGLIPLQNPARYDPQPLHQLIQALRTRLATGGVTFNVAGAVLDSMNVELNTALVAGSDPVRLAAKIHGWCESHCWFDGPDRAWVASIIDEGLDAGIYRRGIWYVDKPFEGPASAHPDRKWLSQGWEEVRGFLLIRDDEPVVLSYSVCDQFPNPATHPSWPGEHNKPWSDHTPERQQAMSEWDEKYYDEMRDDEKWQGGMEWLRQHRPWAQITPDNLRSTSFGPMVTVYDLLSPDRDDVVRQATAKDPS